MIPNSFEHQTCKCIHHFKVLLQTILPKDLKHLFILDQLLLLLAAQPARGREVNISALIQCLWILIECHGRSKAGIRNFIIVFL